MKKIWTDVKSFVTVAMTVALIALLVLPVDPPKELLSLFCTSYGAVITYFFTRKTQDSIIESKVFTTNEETETPTIETSDTK